MTEPNGVTRGILAAARYAEADARRMAELDALIAAGKGDKRQTQQEPRPAVLVPDPPPHKDHAPKTRQRPRQAPRRPGRRVVTRSPLKSIELLSSQAVRRVMDACARELRRRSVR